MLVRYCELSYDRFLLAKFRIFFLICPYPVLVQNFIILLHPERPYKVLFSQGAVMFVKYYELPCDIFLHAKFRNFSYPSLSGFGP
jgi:hypothetical protein